MNSGAGIYFDGVTSTRRDVAVALAPSSLRISAQDGRLLAEWPYDEIEGLAAPDNVLRLGRRGSATLERLEILDPAFAAEIDARAVPCRPNRVAATPTAHTGDRLERGRNSIAYVGRLVRGAGDRGSIDARCCRRRPSASWAMRSICRCAACSIRARRAPALIAATAPSETAGRAALDKMLRRLESSSGPRPALARQLLCGVTRPMPWLCPADRFMYSAA